MKIENPERKLKLIWDFRGPDAARTAQHHAIHLQEYVRTHPLSVGLTGVEPINEQHYIAFLVVKEPEMPGVRDALKPHRGQLFEK